MSGPSPPLSMLGEKEGPLISPLSWESDVLCRTRMPRVAIRSHWAADREGKRELFPSLHCAPSIMITWRTGERETPLSVSAPSIY